ncbi:MAG: Rap1a/Tai family immunity protein [Woeseiaceae bacterium]
MIRKFAPLSVGCMLLFGPIAHSVEPLSTPELAEHCAFYNEDRAGEDAIFCVRYIQGFIDGAVATDERVIQNISAELDQDETYMERAARTRLGSRALRFGPTVYADFCLGEPVALEEVVEKVVNNLANRPFLDEQLLARDAVFYTLRTEYPCAPDSDN